MEAERGDIDFRFQLASRSRANETEKFGGVLVFHGLAIRFPYHLESTAGHRVGSKLPQWDTTTLSPFCSSRVRSIDQSAFDKRTYNTDSSPSSDV